MDNPHELSPTYRPILFIVDSVHVFGVTLPHVFTQKVYEGPAKDR